MKEQIIKTHPFIPEYSHAAVPTYNPELMRFVHNELADCMRAAYPGIAGLRYVEDMTETLHNGQERHYRQAVIIAFESGYRKVANVEGDSEWSCIEDVMKAILR